MKTLLAAIVLVISFPICQMAQEGKTGIVLPNPKLLTCRGADCSQLWQKQSADGAVFPKQLSIDMEQGCVYGMTARYDRSVSVEELTATIDEQYGKWTVPHFDKGPHRLWRVEPEKFAIQLVVLDKRDEKRGVEAGTKELILIAFGGRSACAH